MLMSGFRLIGHEDVAGAGELDELDMGNAAGDQVGVGCGHEAIIQAMNDEGA